MIDFILNETKLPQLIYVGHSQGATILSVLLSEYKEYNKKIASAHLIAGGILWKARSPFLEPLSQNIDKLKVTVEIYAGMS